MMSRPFVIFALPRSRTAWTSAFLTYGGWFCAHDEARHLRGLADLKAWFAQPMTGSVETAAAPWWRLLPDDVTVATIRRPVHEVANSLARFGFDPVAIVPYLRRLDAKLDQIEARRGALSVSFDELGTEAGCARLFEHCLGVQHDPEWRRAMASVNIQHPMHAMIHYAAAYRPQLDKIASMATARIKADMARRPVVSSDEMVLAVEPFETWRRDGHALFEQHCVAVDEAPGAHWGKNWDLMQALADRGDLQVVTARSNGRMFGYLMTVISPSLESPGVTSAIETTFYASPDARGLGMKLQRAALGALRGRGVDEVFFRAGNRGDGERMGAIYRRLGAERDGELYRMRLN